MVHPQLYTFVKVVECRSFSKAADALFLSRVSVMRQVNALEERIGVRLLERGSSGIRLTPAGKSLYRDSLQIILESGEAVQRARKIAQATLHTVRAGTSLLNPCQPLVSIWDEIRDDYPGLRLRVVPYSDEQGEILDLLSTLGKRFDLFLGVNDSYTWQEVTSFLHLRDEPIQCAVPITHPLASRTSLQVSDLDGQELMMVSEGDSPGNARARAILQSACPDLRIIDVGYYYDIDVFHTCVERNCLLLSFKLWENVHPSLVTIPIEWDCAIPYGLVYPKKPSPEVAAFIEAVRGYLQHETA